MDLDDGVCASCGQPLGIRANWRIANGGRAYHNDCEPAGDEGLVPEDTADESESLSEFAERKARGVMHGKGQQQLEDRGKDSP